MLIAPVFVMLHNPKTGSSFLRKAIQRVVDSSRQCATEAPRSCCAHHQHSELLLPRRRGGAESGKQDHHGTFSQIPELYRDRVVVSACRNPFSLLVSQYEYRLWATRPGVREEVLSAEFPAFPDLTFSQFLRLQECEAAERWGLSARDSPIGPLSAHFIQMFGVNPLRLFESVSVASNLVAAVTAGLGQVRFLRHERLRNDLETFLLERGYCEAAVSTIHAVPPSNVTRMAREWGIAAFRTDGLDTYVMRREAVLFGVLASCGILYTLENCTFGGPAAQEPTRTSDGN